MKETAKMHIVMLDNGSIQVSGPLANTALCYAMLEMARDAVKGEHDRLISESQRRVLPATPDAVAAINGGRRT